VNERKEKKENELTSVGKKERACTAQGRVKQGSDHGRAADRVMFEKQPQKGKGNPKALATHQKRIGKNGAYVLPRRGKGTQLTCMNYRKSDFPRSLQLCM